ncbi:MAG: hypothetical protein V8T62_00600 [Oscillospiraceae bacterium]
MVDLQVLTDQNAYYYSESGKEKEEATSFQEKKCLRRKVKRFLLGAGGVSGANGSSCSLLGASGEAEGAVSLQFSVDDIDVNGSRSGRLYRNL